MSEDYVMRVFFWRKKTPPDGR